jgi:hypothetical protein
MDIKIIGKTKHMCKAEIKFATAFFANYVMGERLAKNLDFEIRIEDQGKNEGCCNPLDAERRPRSFEIGIRPGMQRYKMLQCLAHEMVHVKQYARGELSSELITAKWQGKTFKLTNSMEDYLNWPWEVEAYGRDRSLYLFYQVMLKSEKVKFKNGKLYIGGKLMRFKKLDKTAG